MAHFAKIGMKGKVIQVLTLDDKDMQDHEGKAVEAIGQRDDLVTIMINNNCLFSVPDGGGLEIGKEEE